MPKPHKAAETMPAKNKILIFNAQQRTKESLTDLTKDLFEKFW
jgi:hypothetical protein